MQFKDVIGHKSVKERLIKTVNEGRISHAQLFLGKEGSGNLPLAIAYAQYISCQHKLNDDSCGECPSCIKFQKLIHPDLHFVFPVATSNDVKKDPISANYLIQWREALLQDSYLSIANWQQKIGTGNKQLLISKNESESILRVLSLKTYESEYKIMIIWYPEKFNTHSGNRLLKIIEEPPNKTLFILVAHDVSQIISTILSRTQLVKIGRVNENVLKQDLINRFAIEETFAQNIAKLSDGNIIQSKKIIEQSEQEELFYTLFTSWMRAAFKADVATLIKWTDEIAKPSFGREKQRQFLDYSLHIFRESLITNYGSSDLGRIAHKEKGFVANFAPYIHGANCIEIINLFNDASNHIERNANPKILFMDVSLKLTKLLRVKAPSENQ